MIVHKNNVDWKLCKTLLEFLKRCMFLYLDRHFQPKLFWFYAINYIKLKSYTINQVCSNGYKGTGLGVGFFFTWNRTRGLCYTLLEWCWLLQRYWRLSDWIYFFPAKYFAPKRQQIHIFTVVTKPALCLLTLFSYLFDFRKHSMACLLISSWSLFTKLQYTKSYDWKAD